MFPLLKASWTLNLYFELLSIPAIIGVVYGHGIVVYLSPPTSPKSGYWFEGMSKNTLVVINFHLIGSIESAVSLYENIIVFIVFIPADR